MATRKDLEWAQEMPLESAVVLYDTVYGKTRQVAEALARGFRSEGVRTDVLSVAEAAQRPVDSYDLLAFGSPAHHLAPTKPMREFLHALRRMPKLHQHFGYAFETRVRHHPGGAAGRIEAELEKVPLRLPRGHDVAVVVPPRTAAGQGLAPDGMEFHLESGTEGMFEAIGVDIVQRARGERKEDFS